MSNLQKYTDGAKDWELAKDFGATPIALANFSDDKAMVAILGGLSCFVSTSFFGPVGLLLAGTIAINDYLYLCKDKNNTIVENPLKSALDIIDTLEVEYQAILHTPVVESVPTPIEQPIEAKPVVTSMSVNVDNAPIKSQVAVRPSFTNISNLDKVNGRVNEINLETKIDIKPKKERPTAVDIFISDPYESRCIFGSQRTGKSYFAAVVSSKLAIKGTRIYHINLASYGVEDQKYWQHAYRSVCADISAMDAYDAKYQIDRATQLIFDFYADPNPAILIIDEIAYLGSTGNYHKASLEKLVTVMADKITVLSSSGKKRKKAVWTIAPEFVAGAVTQDTKAVKKLTLCYVTIHPEKTVDWEGQDIGFNSSLFDQIKTNYSIFYPVDLPNEDRVIFIGDQWMSIGNLDDDFDTKVNVSPDVKHTKNDSEDGKKLYDRALECSKNAHDFNAYAEILGLASSFDNPQTIKRLQEIILLLPVLVVA